MWFDDRPAGGGRLGEGEPILDGAFPGFRFGIIV